VSARDQSARRAGGNPSVVRRYRVYRRRRRTTALAVAAIVAVVLLAARGGSSGPAALDLGAFAPGACVAYPPTSGNRGETVFLDAGHGGIDPGGVGATEAGRPVQEARVNLPIELEVTKLLRARGLRVVVSRTRSSTVVRLRPVDLSQGSLSLQGAHDDVAARDICANLAHAAVLVGIYMDAGNSQEAGSITAYDPDRPFAGANRRLAELLQTDVLSAMDRRGWGIPNGGVEPDTGLGSYVGDASSGGLAGAAAAYDHLMLIGPAAAGFFTTPSRMPGAVIEPLYLTDPFEGSIAASRAGQTTIARGIATAIEQFLSPTSSAAVALRDGRRAAGSLGTCSRCDAARADMKASVVRRRFEFPFVLTHAYS
jgi:N-acetylmuramoyl-L-alanine amidase